MFGWYLGGTEAIVVMRWFRVLAAAMVGVLLGQLIPPSPTLAADDEIGDLPPGSIVLMGEITKAEDYGVANLLTGPIPEKNPGVAWVQLDYEVTEKDFLLVLFPDGTAIGEGDVVREVETRTRSEVDGRTVEWHADFVSGVEFGIEATWSGDDPWAVTGTFVMRSEVITTIAYTTTEPGEPGEISSGDDVFGRFEAQWSPSGGTLTGTITPEDPTASPGILTVEAVGVHVEPPLRSGTGLLQGDGPHGIDLALLGTAIGPCQERWTNDAYKTILGLCEQMVKPATWEGESELVVDRIIWTIDKLIQFPLPENSSVPIFPSLRNEAMVLLISRLGQMARGDPLNVGALNAMVKLFNFNLHIQSPCIGQGCPA